MEGTGGTPVTTLIELVSQQKCPENSRKNNRLFHMNNNLLLKIPPGITQPARENPDSSSSETFNPDTTGHSILRTSSRSYMHKFQISDWLKICKVKFTARFLMKIDCFQLEDVPLAPLSLNI